MLPIELLLDEPFYQLMRQQLLAQRLEQDRVHDADVVRVLHVLAPENTGYQDSSSEPNTAPSAAPSTMSGRSSCGRPTGSVHVDPVVFLDPAVTSDEYVDRYSHAARQMPEVAVVPGDPTVGPNYRAGQSRGRSSDLVPPTQPSKWSKTWTQAPSPSHP